MPDKICLLCKDRKVYEIKSHLTPAVLSETTFGERDKELIYTIDSGSKKIDTYYGPGHPQTEDTTVRIAPNVRKGIFCKICEDNLGHYEHATQPNLLEVIANLGRGHYEIAKSNAGVKYVTLNLHENILITFFQSVIWRQCMEQIIDGYDSPLPANDLEELRLAVYENISVPVKDIINHTLTNYQPMVAFSSYGLDIRSATYTNPHTLNTNPRLFFLSPITILYTIKESLTKNISEYLAIDNGLLAGDLELSSRRIAVVSSSQWKRTTKRFAHIVAG